VGHRLLGLLFSQRREQQEKALIRHQRLRLAREKASRITGPDGHMHGWVPPMTCTPMNRKLRSLANTKNFCQSTKTISTNTED